MQSADLIAQSFERPGVVDHIVRRGESRLPLGLRPDDGAHLILGQPATLAHAGNLHRFGQIHYKYAVDPAPIVRRLDEKWYDMDHVWSGCAGDASLGFLPDHRVQDPFKALLRRWIREDTFAHSLSVH